MKTYQTLYTTKLYKIPINMHKVIETKEINLTDIKRNEKYIQLIMRPIPSDYQQLKDGIKKHGIIKSLIVTEDLVLIDGYTRIQIAEELGIIRVKCDIVNIVDDIEIIDYIVSLNQDRRHETKASRARNALQYEKQMEELDEHVSRKDIWRKFQTNKNDMERTKEILEHLDIERINDSWNEALQHGKPIKDVLNFVHDTICAACGYEIKRGDPSKREIGGFGKDAYAKCYHQDCWKKRFINENATSDIIKKYDKKEINLSTAFRKTTSEKNKKEKLEKERETKSKCVYCGNTFEGNEPRSRIDENNKLFFAHKKCINEREEKEREEKEKEEYLVRFSECIYEINLIDFVSKHEEKIREILKKLAEKNKPKWWVKK